MNIYAIDDEKMALNALVRAIEEAVPDAAIYSFTKPSELIAALPATPCDVAFMDIRMPGITGLELAGRIKAVYPNVNIIFVTGYGEHGVEAMNLRASGYLMKPVTKDKVEQEMLALRNPINTEPDGKKLYIQAFGNFEVFAKGEKLNFRRAKTKELFAYLVDRMGADCTMGELMAVLWENGDDSRSMQSHLRVLIADLRQMLKDADASDAIIKGRNMIALNMEMVNCDYYNYLKSPRANKSLYRGEYMSQYSWSETTNARLQNSD